MAKLAFGITSGEKSGLSLALRVLLVCGFALTSCHDAEPLPPPIDAATLQRLIQTDIASLPTELGPRLTPRCITHRATRGLSYRNAGYGTAGRIKLIFGFGRLSRWEKPGENPTRVDPALEADLRRASTRVILDMPSPAPSPELRAPPSCATSYLLSAPSYAGRLAFLDRDFLCDLCGSGATLAMKYDGTAWRLVAIHDSWVS